MAFVLRTSYFPCVPMNVLCKCRRQRQPQHHSDQCTEKRPAPSESRPEPWNPRTVELLEVELPADFEEPRLQHVRRPQPPRGCRRRERIRDRKRPVAVEDVVEVEVEANPVMVQ